MEAIKQKTHADVLASSSTGRLSPELLTVKRVKSDKKYGVLIGRHSVSRYTSKIKSDPVDFRNHHECEKGFVHVKNEPADGERLNNAMENIPDDIIIKNEPTDVEHHTRAPKNNLGDIVMKTGGVENNLADIIMKSRAMENNLADSVMRNECTDIDHHNRAMESNLADSVIKNECTDIEDHTRAMESNLADIIIKNETADVNREVMMTAEEDSTHEVEDAWLPDATTVKQELDIGLTVLQPCDMHFITHLSKPADPTPGGIFADVEEVGLYNPPDPPMMLTEAGDTCQHNDVVTTPTSSRLDNEESGCNGSTPHPTRPAPGSSVPAPHASKDISTTRTSKIDGYHKPKSRTANFTHVDGEMDQGSDIDEHKNPNFLDMYCSFIRHPTLATDSPSFMPKGLHPQLAEELSRLDVENDNAIGALLPTDSLSFDWSSDLSNFHGNRETFTGVPGPTFPLSEMGSPVDVFLKIWDLQIMTKIVEETNLYAEIHMNSQVGQPRNWYPTDVGELSVFFAILLHQTLTPLTLERDYFDHSYAATAMPYSQNCISYSRFLLLKRYIHFKRNSSIHPSLSLRERRLLQMKPLADHLSMNFSSLYLPHRNIVINESLLQCRGNFDFAQKIANNARADTKSCELYDAETGYLWKFLIYIGPELHQQPNNIAGQHNGTNTTGKVFITKDGHFETSRPDYGTTGQGKGDHTNQLEDIITGRNDEKPSGRPDELIHGYNAKNRKDQPDDRRNFTHAGAPAKIIYDLASPLFNKGYTLIMDNFHSSPSLARCLKLQQTDCYGPLRLNRKNIPESLKCLRKTHFSNASVVSFTSGDLNILSWKEKKFFSMISTYHEMKIKAAERFVNWLYKPKVVLDYNKNMASVDKKDQLLAGFPLEMDYGYICYKELFRRLLNISVLNAFIIHASKNPGMTHRTFRQMVTEGLFKLYNMRSIDTTVPSSVTITRLVPTMRGEKPRPLVENNHFCVKNLDEPTMRQCIWCCLQTSRKCDMCNVPLCIDCMKPYHTREWDS